MRSSRIILSRPAYHHVSFELFAAAPPLEFLEMREFERLLLAASKFHDMPLAAYSVGPTGSHILILDRQPATVSWEEALELNAAMNPASLSAVMKLTLDREAALSPCARRKAEKLPKLRGGLEPFTRSIKGRLGPRIGRRSLDRFWADRFRSHPVQNDFSVRLGMLFFVHSFDVKGHPIASQKHPSSWLAAESGDEDCRSAMSEFLGLRDWRAVRTAVRSQTPETLKLSLRRNRKGGVTPHYGEIPKTEMAAAQRRSARRKPDKAKVDAHFDKMFKRWKAHENSTQTLSQDRKEEFRRWVHLLRMNKQRGKLRPEWEAKLSAAGFQWRAKKQAPKHRRLLRYEDTLAAVKWKEQLGVLQEYKQLHGPFSMPPRCGKLGNWISIQRAKKRQGILRDWQIEALNKLNFPWLGRRGSPPGKKSAKVNSGKERGLAS